MYFDGHSSSSSEESYTLLSATGYGVTFDITGIVEVMFNDYKICLLLYRAFEINAENLIVMVVVIGVSYNSTVAMFNPHLPFGLLLLMALVYIV